MTPFSGTSFLLATRTHCSAMLKIPFGRLAEECQQRERGPEVPPSIVMLEI